MSTPDVAGPLIGAGPIASPPPAKTERRTIRSIDGLKGVAAIGIVIFHMTAALAYSPELGFTAGWFGKYFLLLDLFFIISGYGVASGYARTFEHGVTAQSYGQFLWGRFIRLYPLYLFVLLVLVGQDLAYLVTKSTGVLDPGYEPFGRETANVENLIYSLLMVQSWGFTYKLVWNIPAWYVSALVCAYLAFPFIAWGVSKIPPAQRGPFLIVAMSLATIALHIAFQARAFPAPNDQSPLRAILEFTLGYGIAQLRAGPAWKRHLQLPVLILVFVGFHMAWRDWQILMLLALFLWTLLDDEGLVARVLGSRPLVWLGAASYGIFLVHQPILSWFDALGRASWSDQVWILWSENFSWNIALRFVVIILVGWAAQRFIATPAQKWLAAKKG